MQKYLYLKYMKMYLILRMSLNIRMTSPIDSKNIGLVDVNFYYKNDTTENLKKKKKWPFDFNSSFFCYQVDDMTFLWVKNYKYTDRLKSEESAFWDKASSFKTIRDIESEYQVIWVTVSTETKGTVAILKSPSRWYNWSCIGWSRGDCWWGNR